MDHTTSKSVLSHPIPPPLHAEDLGIDPTLPPTLDTITHLALLLHAAKAEYTYWRTRAHHLSMLLTQHKSAVMSQHNLSEAEAWELQLQADAEAQLLQDLDREAEMKVEMQLRSEAEERVEREAERQLLVEAGVVSEEDEGWRRVGITGRGKKVGVGKCRSLVRPRMSGSLRAEESKAELGKVEVMKVVNAIPEVEAVKEKDVGVTQPPKTEEEAFEESHGKARWTRRRSLRRNMRTMNDLRSFARSGNLHDSDCAVEDSHRSEPTRRQSLPSLGRKEYYRPPTLPQENLEIPLQQPPAPMPKQQPLGEPISPPPSPPQLQPETHTKPRTLFPTNTYTPLPRPITPPSKDHGQHQHSDHQSIPPSPPHSTAFTRAQSILLDLKSPIKGFLNTYPYLSAPTILSTALPIHPSSSSGPVSRSRNPPEPTSNPPPHRTSAEWGFLQGRSSYETEAPPTLQKQLQIQNAPTPARMRRLERDSIPDNGHGNTGYARILERRSERRYVKDERWGWRAV